MKIQNQAWTTFSTNRYQKNDNAITKTLEKLSGGNKLTRAADNASGLSISETMRGQIHGLARAQLNMQDGLSVLETTDVGLQHVSSVLQRIRELAVQTSTDTVIDGDREAAQYELDQLLQSVDDTADKMEFNTQSILGDVRPLYIHVGANSGQTLRIDTVNVSTASLGIAIAKLSSRGEAEELITKVDNAQSIISKHLANTGSDYDALTHHKENVSNIEVNLQKTESLIRDPDLALEMIEFVKQGIRQKGDELLIKHTNENVSDVLRLFG
ncbi:flagellin [Bacillus sp. FJAT-22090]|uniref:flagellin N-terminal helical domain-containing protein n=1 Tax=Bacillus sp. FJAT-22090 TaxID=1581038 RepID=UPI0006ADE14A|nr:flagellin [Bacillus sp. FJAT-22090]ALC86339.1 flagellin [Bacillus sp. FJAT-22090]